MAVQQRRFTSGDLEIRAIRFSEVGDMIPDHDHNFPHTTIIFTGVFKLRGKLPNGALLERVFSAPSHALIHADVMRSIECIEPGEVWCTFCHRDPLTGAPIPESNGWEPAYV